MKLTRVLSVLLAALVLVAGMLATGCSATPALETGSSTPEYTAPEPPAAGADVALVVTSAMTEGDFTQAAQAAVNKFAGEAGLTSGVYRADGGDEAVRANIELAVKGGAKLMVLIGTDLAAAAADAQQQHPEIDFILLGMGPEATVADNAVRVAFSPEQGGWLAGYAAVWEGCRVIGWLGDDMLFAGDDGTPEEADTQAAREAQARVAMRSGLGFLLGAEAAARELGLEAGSVVALSPAALPPDDDGPDAGESYSGRAARLYGQGAELVFANIPGSQNEALLAAEADGEEGRVIGYSLYPGESARLLVNVKHDPSDILASLLDSWQNGRFPGGSVALATVGNGGVGLDMARANLQGFDETYYEGLCEAIRFGTLDADISRALAALAMDETVTPGDLPLGIVTAPPAETPPESSSAP